MAELLSGLILVFKNGFRLASFLGSCLLNTTNSWAWEVSHNKNRKLRQVSKSFRIINRVIHYYSDTIRLDFSDGIQDKGVEQEGISIKVSQVPRISKFLAQKSPIFFIGPIGYLRL